MRALRRLLSSPYRRARKAEGEGDYRRAAALYVEADAPEEAASALLFHAARATTLDDRVAAYHDALRWLPEGHVRRPDIEARIGLAVLDEARRRGIRGAEEERRLEDAAGRLERAARWADAATAWELLGRLDETARCLEAGGEIERLEQLLDRTQARDQRERRLRHLVDHYEMALAGGARLEARAAIKEAVALAPEDAGIAELARRLEARLAPSGRVELDVAGRRVLLVGKMPATLGRAEADVALRGASVSRCHAEIAARDGAIVVRDLGSRNGTLVRGVPLAGEIEVGGDTEIGLGDDVTLRLTKSGGAAVRLEVVRGLDRGLVVLAGEGPLAIPGAAASVSFPDGHATLVADAGAPLVLGSDKCAAPVVLLEGDVLRVGEVSIEVRA